MDTPTSDFDGNGSFEPSEPSTPGTPIEPFEVLFKIKVTEPIKDGEVVKYTVKTTALSEKEEEYKVVRQYEDFEWLHHLLMTQNNIMGLIIPPLPIKPIVEAKGAEKQSKKQLGTSSKVLIGDEFHKDCRSLEKYLRLMIAHPVFGKDKHLETFLTEKQAPTRTKVKKGLFGKLSSAVEEARKANHRDIDDYFQRERDWTQDYAAQIKESSNSYNKMVYAEQRIACAYGHLSTALTLGSGVQDEEAAKANKLLMKMSEAVDDAKHGAEVDATNDENTLGFQLDLMARYGESLREMLYRRTCLLIEYEDANKALAKAKPQKRQEAEDHKVQCERTFEESSETARREIQVFRRQQLLALQEALTLYSEAKVKTARDTYALLAKSLAMFKKMED